MTRVRRTRRWRGVIAVALFAGAAGLLFKRPAILLMSVVGIAYGAYPRLPRTPGVELGIDRRLGTDEPREGETVTVEVTVHNEGSRTLPDLRLVDGVPPMLAVSEGTPRHTATLRPGGSTTFTYGVRARQGTHRFEPATAIARDVSGATEVETEVATETTIECVADVPEIPLRSQTGEQVGDVLTDKAGTGVEFHRNREYQRGDEMNRIDWNRFARTGDLATMEFHQERAAAVVICLDVRAPSYRSPDDDSPHAVAYELAAAEQLLGGLAETNNTYGLASFGGRESCWVAPAAGTEHRQSVAQTLATHPALTPYPPEADDDAVDDQVTAIERRLAADNQVAFLSPLLDDVATSTALGLEAAGHAVVCISPDVTTDETPGGKLARTERRNRVQTLRSAGVRVIDWDVERPLGTALVEAEERWSA